MKKVLIFAYDFPPYNSIGAQRPDSWWQYLPEFGYHPVIITRHWDSAVKDGIDYIRPSQKQEVEIEEGKNSTLIRVPFRPNLRDKLLLKYGLHRFSLLRKTLSLFYKGTEFFMPAFDNRYSLYQAAKNYANQHPIDCVIATGEPFILFRYAHKLAKQLQLPWLADYRDGWSSNYNRGKFDRVFYRFIEKRLVQTAARITTVSQAFAHQIKALHQKEVAVIYNGYFPEKFRGLPAFENREDFILSFAGTLYPYQPIEVLGEALKLLPPAQLSKITVQCIGVEFYPEQAQRIKNSLASLPIQLITTKRLPHTEALSKLNQSHAFLLPASPQHAQIYAKVFDYMALKKPILLFQNDNGELARLLTETQSGLIADTAPELAASIQKLYNEWQTTGQLACQSQNIEAYSRKAQCRRLAGVLDRVCL